MYLEYKDRRSKFLAIVTLLNNLKEIFPAYFVAKYNTGNSHVV